MSSGYNDWTKENERRKKMKEETPQLLKTAATSDVPNEYNICLLILHRRLHTREDMKDAVGQELIKMTMTLEDMRNELIGKILYEEMDVRPTHSTGICGTPTRGYGELDSNGYFQYPFTCEEINEIINIKEEFNKRGEAADRIKECGLFDFGSPLRDRGEDELQKTMQAMLAKTIQPDQGMQNSMEEL